MHEIGHAIGLYHEHQRPDRGSHVNVAAAVASSVDYRLVSDGVAIGAYDCDSIMHYGNSAVINNTDLACANMGQRTRLSAGDIAAVAWAKRMSSQNRPYTNENSSQGSARYMGTGGQVEILQGHAADVPVSPSATSVGWCDGSDCNNDTKIPRGTSYIVVIRYLGIDHFDVYAFSRTEELFDELLSLRSQVQELTQLVRGLVTSRHDEGTGSRKEGENDAEPHDDR